MKTITYGIFAEDDAIRIFTQNLIGQLVSHLDYGDKVLLKHNENFTNQMRTEKGGGYISMHFIKFVTKGINEFSLNLCFVGIDSDDKEHLECYETMQARIVDSRLEDRAIVLIPVQAIEYWLWYIKTKKENPDLTTTPIIDRTNSRIELKKWVYLDKNARTRVSNPIVESLSQNIDFPWLVAHSASFKHFHDTFKSYLFNNFGPAE